MSTPIARLRELGFHDWTPRDPRELSQPLFSVNRDWAIFGWRAKRPRRDDPTRDFLGLLSLQELAYRLANWQDPPSAIDQSTPARLRSGATWLSVEQFLEGEQGDRLYLAIEWPQLETSKSVWEAAVEARDRFRPGWLRWRATRQRHAHNWLAVLVGSLLFQLEKIHDHGCMHGNLLGGSDFSNLNLYGPARDIRLCAGVRVAGDSGEGTPRTWLGLMSRRQASNRAPGKIATVELGDDEHDHGVLARLIASFAGWTESANLATNRPTDRLREALGQLATRGDRGKSRKTPACFATTFGLDRGDAWFRLLEDLWTEGGVPPVEITRRLIADYFADGKPLSPAASGRWGWLARQSAGTSIPPPRAAETERGRDAVHPRAAPTKQLGGAAGQSSKLPRPAPEKTVDDRLPRGRDNQSSPSDLSAARQEAHDAGRAGERPVAPPVAARPDPPEVPLGESSVEPAPTPPRSPIPTAEPERREPRPQRADRPADTGAEPLQAEPVPSSEPASTRPSESTTSRSDIARKPGIAKRILAGSKRSATSVALGAATTAKFAVHRSASALVDALRTSASGIAAVCGIVVDVPRRAYGEARDIASRVRLALRKTAVGLTVTLITAGGIVAAIIAVPRGSDLVLPKPGPTPPTPPTKGQDPSGGVVNRPKGTEPPTPPKGGGDGKGDGKGDGEGDGEGNGKQPDGTRVHPNHTAEELAQIANAISEVKIDPDERGATVTFEFEGFPSKININDLRLNGSQQPSTKSGEPSRYSVAIYQADPPNEFSLTMIDSAQSVPLPQELVTKLQEAGSQSPIPSGWSWQRFPRNEPTDQNPSKFGSGQFEWVATPETLGKANAFEREISATWTEDPNNGNLKFTVTCEVLPGEQVELREQERTLASETVKERKKTIELEATATEKFIPTLMIKSGEQSFSHPLDQVPAAVDYYEDKDGDALGDPKVKMPRREKPKDYVKDKSDPNPGKPDELLLLKDEDTVPEGWTADATAADDKCRARWKDALLDELKKSGNPPNWSMLQRLAKTFRECGEVDPAACWPQFYPDMLSDATDWDKLSEMNADDLRLLEDSVKKNPSAQTMKIVGAFPKPIKEMGYTFETLVRAVTLTPEHGYRWASRSK